MARKTCEKFSHLGQAILTSHLQDSYIYLRNSNFGGHIVWPENLSIWWH